MTAQEITMDGNITIDALTNKLFGIETELTENVDFYSKTTIITNKEMF